MLSRLNISFFMNICSSWWGSCWQIDGDKAVDGDWSISEKSSYPSISRARVSICLFHITTSFKDPFHQFNFLFLHIICP